MICLNLKSIESVVVEKMTRMWLYLGISGPRPALDHARVPRVTLRDLCGTNTKQLVIRTRFETDPVREAQARLMTAIAALQGSSILNAARLS